MCAQPQLQLLVAVVMIVVCIYSRSQAQCPPDSDCEASWSAELTKTIEIRSLPCVATFVYQERICKGVREYYIVDINYKGMCEAMMPFSIYHYNYNAAIDIATLSFIEQSEYAVPFCPGGVQRANVYTASCGIFVGCEYKIDPASRTCDQGYLEPYPEYQDNGVDKIKHYQWQSCGTTCCRRNIEFCYDTTLRVKRSSIITKERLLPCSGQSKYGSQECLDGC